MAKLRIEQTTLGEIKKVFDRGEFGDWTPGIFKPNFKFPFQVVEETEVRAKNLFPNDPKKQKIWFWHHYNKECMQRGWGGWTKEQIQKKLPYL